jgi:uncharacterized protein YkwD
MASKKSFFDAMNSLIYIHQNTTGKTMKSIAIMFLLAVAVVKPAANDSLARIAAGIINDERRRIGVDTLEYEIDKFCFATDWADSTNQYFNVDNKPFSRDSAHRNFDQRYEMYEIIGKQEWKHIGECVGTGSISGDTERYVTERLAYGLLKSKDHYEVLMKRKYEKIRIGVSVKNNHVAIVVFTITECK